MEDEISEIISTEIPNLTSEEADSKEHEKIEIIVDGGM